MAWFANKGQVIQLVVQICTAIGWSTMLTVVTGFIQKLRSGSLDWWVLGAAFVSSFVIMWAAQILANRVRAGRVVRVSGPSLNVSPPPWEAPSQAPVPLREQASLEAVASLSLFKAQGQSPLVIHEAGYGLGLRQELIVTTQVCELVQDGELHVRVHPTTLHCPDPYPGQFKRLRVVCSCGYIKNRTVERYDEEMLNLPQDMRR